MNNSLKAICLATYLLAAFGPFIMLPAGVTSTLQIVAVALLAAHVLELLYAYRFIGRHPGPLIDSITLSLLFGFLHWKPLSKDS